MKRCALKSKIHRARVTGADVDYEGSITIDEGLMEAADILPYERVQVLSVDSGERLETYAIPGERGSGEVRMNGAAAKVIGEGETVIILAYAWLEEEELEGYRPKIAHVSADNGLLNSV